MYMDLSSFLPSDQSWSGAGEAVVSSQQNERPWSPSLQREMTRMTGTEQSNLEDVVPLVSEQWQPVEALGPPEKEDRPHVPLETELSQRTRAQLDTLSRSAHLAQPRFGLDIPLDPLVSSSSLKYVHEGDLLKLRLLLDNLTLEGLSSLSVQEVSSVLNFARNLATSVNSKLSQPNIHTSRSRFSAGRKEERRRRRRN